MNANKVALLKNYQNLKQIHLKGFIALLSDQSHLSGFSKIKFLREIHSVCMLCRIIAIKLLQAC